MADSDEFEEFIRAQDAKNTWKGNSYAVNTVKRYFRTIGETRETFLFQVGKVLIYNHDITKTMRLS